MPNLPNANELLAELQGVALHTTQGSFVKWEDVRRLILQEDEGETQEEPPKTMLEARRKASEHLKSEGFGAKLPQAGPPIAAREEPPTVVEDVKRREGVEWVV